MNVKTLLRTQMHPTWKNMNVLVSIHVMRHVAQEFTEQIDLSG